MIKITDGNAFILRVQGITRNGDYEAEVDLSQIDSMTANFVRRGRSTQESSFDSSGRLLISNEGTLDKGVYGVEMVGYYNGQPWRSYAKNVFEIVNANVDADDSDATMNDVPIYDVTIAVTLGGSGVTADFVDAMIAKHSDDETSHPYLIDKIEDAGKVDDVKVNNVSVVDENKNANIQVPTTVAELNDANNYATKNYVDAQMATAGHVDDVKVNGQSVVSNKEANINIPTTVAELEDADDYATNEGVEEALAAKQNTITETSVEYTEDGGSPDASVEFEDGVMTFQMKNMKMKFSELTAAEIEALKGPKGDPGNSAVFDPNTGNILATLHNTTGDDDANAMTQKAVTEAIENSTADVTDLSSEFEFTDGKGLTVSNNTLANSTQFAYSNYVDVSDYAGGILRITIPRWNSGSGTASGYGLIFYNANNTKISGKSMEKYSTNTAVHSIGDVQVYELNIPANAVSVRTTYFATTSSFYDSGFMAKAIVTSKKKINDIDNDIAALKDVDENLSGQMVELTNDVNGGFRDVNVDLTEQFSWTNDGNGWASNGNVTSGLSKFARSSAVDISQYQGKYLRIAIPRYTSGSNGYAGVYLLIYDNNETPAIIAYRAAPKYPGTGTATGDVALFEVYIPEGAATVKTSFYKSGSAHINIPFSCRIVERVYGANERVENMSQIVNGVDGEEEIKDYTWTADHAIIGYGNGSSISATGQSASSYIDIEGYDSIRVTVNKRAATITVGCAFFNSSNQCLATYRGIEKAEGADEVETVSYKVPVGATKFRTTILTTLKGQFKMYGYKSKTVRADIEQLKNRFLYPLIGSPRIYHGSELSGVAPFDSVAEVEAAWEALAAAHPDWLTKKDDIGRDASDTYDIHHYEMGWQHKDINNERYRSGSNYWTDVKFKPRRLLLNLGTHCSERGALLAGYLTIKEILESSEEWAQFIKANCIIDIIPLLNPWGLDHGRSDKNSNEENINRHFTDLSEAENQAAASLVQELIPKGLIGCIDLHNSGSNTQSYLVSSSQYKYFSLYARLSVQLQGIMYETLNEYFGANSSEPYNEHFHLWDCGTTELDKTNGVRPTGQLHWYINKMELLGVTLEMYPASSPAEKIVPSAKISKDFAINLIQCFIAMI